MKSVYRIALASVLSLLIPFSVFAASQRPFDAKAFETAQATGQPILIEVHADWCPTCRAQLPILNKLSNEAAFENIQRFRVDFDANKDLVKKFGAKIQSTLVLYKGKQEVARSAGETDESQIRAMLAKAR